MHNKIPTALRYLIGASLALLALAKNERMLLKKAGFAEHLTKPVDFSAIEAVLGRVHKSTVGG